MLTYNNTNIRFGLQREDFKLQWGSRAVSPVEAIDEYPQSLTLSAGRRDWAAFQVILWSSDDWVLNTGNAPWFSQKGSLPVLRVAVDGPFAAEIHPIDMHQDNDNLWKADAILTNPVLELEGKRARAVWVELEIPEDTVPGDYTCHVSLYAGSMFTTETRLTEAAVQITVADCRMPAPAEHRFHLDLWQHLSNIARKHETPLWSDEHFAVLEKYVRSLGELGQKAVTLVVSQVPWAGQGCHDEYRMAANLYEYSIILLPKRPKASPMITAPCSGTSTCVQHTASTGKSPFSVLPISGQERVSVRWRKTIRIRSRSGIWTRRTAVTNT